MTLATRRLDITANLNSTAQCLNLEFGGFEGNAQTLRILGKLEKKQTADYPHKTDIPEPIARGIDHRTGLNMTYRSLAAILKYDHQIPRTLETRERGGSSKKPIKGYYHSELELVRLIKDHVVSSDYKDAFKTIECSIMDIADDIAYSTYDLEDAFKGGFLTPLTILAMPKAFKTGIVDKIRAKIDLLYGSLPADDRSFTVEDYEGTLRRFFSGVLKIDDSYLPEGDIELEQYHAMVISITTGTSENICNNGYYRTEFTSELVGRFIRAVDVEVNEQFPAMSKAKLSLDAFIAVEILKTLAFEAVIMSSRLKSAENRGQWIVKQIFGELTDSGGYLLMPEDWRTLVEATDDDTTWKRRMICDYIAGMTDAYCLEFYERILGRAAPSIQKQH
jgi:dGTPase